jgi:biotin transporter BioY
MLGIAAFALLTAVGALIRIPLPFTPVPITLQTLLASSPTLVSERSACPFLLVVGC